MSGTLSLARRECIAAVATPPGRGGIGIVRVSGSDLFGMARALCGASDLRPRYAHYGDFLDEHGDSIDRGILLYFPAPHSFTGEDVIELQAHGSPVVLNMLLERCLQLGARLAEPGEFSLRAFLNDRIDLLQAESIADLIDAQSQSAARMALRSLQGVFSQEIHQLVRELTDLRVLAEATLDFPEEELEYLQAAQAAERLQALDARLSDILRHSQQGVILCEGVRVVLIGAPNVGKSSLLNALTGEETAIVTAVAGTTRDAVREDISIDGVALHVIDTAGLHPSDDPVEQIGMERSRLRSAEADFALLLVDPQQGLNETTQALLDSLPESIKVFEIQNKIDLYALTAEVLYPPQQFFYPRAECCIRLSAKNGEGIDLLKKEILRSIGWQGAHESLFSARSRHLEALRRAQSELQQAQHVFSQVELMAEHLREAQNALGSITGEVSSDDLLGEIFSRFCMGK